VATKAGPNANPRAKVIFSSLIRHLHAFAREVELTNKEWLMACDSMVKAGQISSPARNEMVLISDVLGLESLVDSMAHERLQSIVTDKGCNGNAEEITGQPSLSVVFGKKNRFLPCYSIDHPQTLLQSPSYENGESIVLTHKPNDVTAHAHVYGTVKDINGRPILGAQVDI